MMGIAMLIATLIFGARIVEKHVTLSKSIPGPDSTFSLAPSAFKLRVSFVKETKKTLERVCYSITNSEQTNHYSVVIFIRSNSMVQTV
jgi:pseudaminic acid synthase